MDLDFHPPAMAAVDAEFARLGDDDAVGPDAVFFQDVEPGQTVAVLFLDGAHDVQGVIAEQAQLADELARVNHAGHAGALIAGAASVDVPVLDLATIRVPGPLLRVAYTDGI